MRDVDCELSMQRYQDLLREAEAYRFARELGLTEAGTLRSITAKIRAWLSQITSPEVTSSDEAFMHGTHPGS